VSCVQSEELHDADDLLKDRRGIVHSSSIHIYPQCTAMKAAEPTGTPQLPTSAMYPNQHHQQQQPAIQQGNGHNGNFLSRLFRKAPRSLKQSAGAGKPPGNNQAGRWSMDVPVTPASSAPALASRRQLETFLEDKAAAATDTITSQQAHIVPTETRRAGQELQCTTLSTRCSDAFSEQQQQQQQQLNRRPRAAALRVDVQQPVLSTGALVSIICTWHCSCIVCILARILSRCMQWALQSPQGLLPCLSTHTYEHFLHGHPPDDMFNSVRHLRSRVIDGLSCV
jgi:hypothetical protein